MGTFPEMDQEKITFSFPKLHIGVRSEFFLDNHPFNYLGENIITNFSVRKDIDFCCVHINGDIRTI